MNYTWDFSAVLSTPYFWLAGAGITLAYGFATIIVGILIGLVLGALSLSKSKLVGWIIDIYVQTFRCTPLLVQIVWFYYALPVLLGVNFPPWIAAGLGLSLYMGAFSTEIFRAGVNSIEKGQWQASRALGMTQFQMMKHIILPQATSRMIPPFVSQSVLQIKNTSLLSVVAVPDLMYRSSIIVSNTFRPLEVYTSVALMYFIILFPLVMLSKRMETRANV